MIYLDDQFGYRHNLGTIRKETVLVPLCGLAQSMVYSVVANSRQPQQGILPRDGSALL